MTLTQLFTAIANAIRTKKGTSASIIAENFPTEISSIETGKLTNAEYSEANDDLDDILENVTPPSATISITQNGTYDVTNYGTANVNVISSYNAKIKTTGASGDISPEYLVASLIEEIPLIDTSEIEDMSYMFYMFHSLITIPLLDTSNVTNMENMFNECFSLVTIPQLNTSNVTNAVSMCMGLSSLENVPVFNLASLVDGISMFMDCESLTNQSLNNILASFATVGNDFTGEKSLIYFGLSEEQAEICITLSNWQALANDGWITGY